MEFSLTMQTPYQNFLSPQIVYPPPVVVTSIDHHTVAIPPHGIVVHQPMLQQNNAAQVSYVSQRHLLDPRVPIIPLSPGLQHPVQHIHFHPGLTGTETTRTHKSEVLKNSKEKSRIFPTRMDFMTFSQRTNIAQPPCRRKRRNKSRSTRGTPEKDDFDTKLKKSPLYHASDCKGSLCEGNNSSDRLSRNSVIMHTVESCLSEENVSRNTGLFEQFSQEGSGFVSLKRVGTHKRAKLLREEEHGVARCITKSLKLDLREGEARNDADQSRLIRSLIAINLPEKKPTVQDLTSLFVTYGNLSQVQVLNPANNLPPLLKAYETWVPDLGKRYCALIEYESSEDAQKACREVNMKNRDSNSLRVALLKPGARLKRTLYRKYKDVFS